jgi:hypothetical protein
MKWRGFCGLFFAQTLLIKSPFNPGKETKKWEQRGSAKRLPVAPMVERSPWNQGIELTLP